MRIVFFVKTIAILSPAAVALMQDVGKLKLIGRFWGGEDDEFPQAQTPFQIADTKRYELRNFHDVSYTATISLGGQDLEAIIDSGSFELVILSKDCLTCGTNRSHLYDPNASQTYTKGDARVACTYASGVAYAEEAYDKIMLDTLEGSQQFFWMMYDADIELHNLTKDDSFGAISGLATTRSAAAFAEYELLSVYEEAQEHKMTGGDMEEAISDIVHAYEAKFEVSKKRKTFLDNLNILDVSVCFGRESLSPGYITWNDTSSKVNPELFVQIPVVGDFYWSVELTDVRIGAIKREVVVDQLSLPESNAGSHVLGCDKDRCSALVDTGSTVISAPPNVADDIDNLLFQWEQDGGSCDDLTLLPDLEFSLGGKVFSLPAESYVAQYSGNDDSFLQVQHVLPRLYSKHLMRRGGSSKHISYSYCASAIAPLNIDSQHGPVWILGIPFFREYYTTFHASHGKASSMSFSHASADCQPRAYPAMQLERTVMGKLRKRKAQLHLDVAKIRISAFADRAQLQMAPKLPIVAKAQRERLEQARASGVVRI